MRFSLVIPAYNEEELLPRMLDTVEAARARYHGGAEQIEIIVANNASTDSTPQLARDRGCRVVDVEPRIIAAVRNGGAAQAHGEILCFCDADMQIHPETFNDIDRAMRSGRVICGATGVKLESMSVGLAVTYAALMPMVWASNMDTGVVFCRRQDFEEMGGYDTSRLLAEDVAFLLAMRRLGRSRKPKQRLARLRTCKAISSTRKFSQFGQWHYFTMAFRLLLGRLGLGRLSEEQLAKQYWYDARD